MEKFVCKNIQFNLIYEPIENIRENSGLFETKFEQEFPSKLNILPDFGDGAPLDIPKITGNTEEYGLNVSKVNSSISRKVKSDVCPKVALEEFKIVIDKLYEIVNEVSQNKILFCGITLDLDYSLADGINATEFITNKYLNKSNIKNLYDVATKFTYVKDDKYYVNYFFSNFRKNKDVSDVISIQIDINDKFRFNSAGGNKSYSDCKISETLYNMALSVINKDLNDILENSGENVGN